MATLFRNSSNFIFSLQFSLISITILSLGILLKFYFPLISELPVVWSCLQSWLTPPYLYVVINFIILTIAASSRFHQKVDDQMVPEPVKVAEKLLQLEIGFDVVMKNPVMEVYGHEEAKDLEVKELVKQTVISEVKVMPTRTESMEIPMESLGSKEKPPVSVRFGHRKIAKGGPEAGKSLRVTKPKRQDTLENTWKMITEGRSMPLARHLKKSDTWETQAHTHNARPGEQVKKSETFDNRNNVSTTLARSQGSGKLRKEPSLSQDDLNRRVESFINKFNEEMRLQRLESLNRYKEVINRGANYQS